jgi:hypothetical protein
MGYSKDDKNTNIHARAYCKSQLAAPLLSNHKTFNPSTGLLSFSVDLKYSEHKNYLIYLCVQLSTTYLVLNVKLFSGRYRQD